MEEAISELPKKTEDHPNFLLQLVNPHNYSGERQWEAVTREGRTVAAAAGPEELRAKL